MASSHAPRPSLPMCAHTTLTTSLYSEPIALLCRRHWPPEEAPPLLDGERRLHEELKQGQGQGRPRTLSRVAPPRPPTGEAAQLQRLTAPILQTKIQPGRQSPLGQLYSTVLCSVLLCSAWCTRLCLSVLVTWSFNQLKRHNREVSRCVMECESAGATHFFIHSVLYQLKSK